jgi:hypothetical protein
MEKPTSFIQTTALFDEDFKYENAAKFLSNFGTNSEPLCAEIFNLVHCHICFLFYMFLNNVREVGG